MLTLRTPLRLGMAALLAIGLVLCASAQEKKVTRKDVPAPVLSAFGKAYPKAQALGYSVETEKGKTYYEVESKEGSVSRDILYNPDGTVVEVEESVAPASLPAAVRQAIQKESASGVIQKAEKVTRGATTSYEVKVKDGDKKLSLTLDPSGKVLEKK